MSRRRKNEDEITEEMVEGIWAENQYKIENIEGYAAAFERAKNIMLNVVDREPSDQEKQDMANAMAELMFLEMVGSVKK